MKKLLKICIVGLITSLVGCNGLQLRYNIPTTTECRILSETLFCIDQVTEEEFEIPLSEAIGFSARSPSDDTKLYEFGQMIMLENLEFSKCRTKSCIRNIIKRH